MTDSTTKQRMAIGIVCSRLKIDKETKEEMVLSYSNGRTTTTTELTYAEADHMLKILNKHVNYEDSPANKMRKKILSLAHEMRWELKGGKIDMKRVNGWCITYGYLKKPLDQYEHNELPELVTQFEKAYRHYLTGI